jgi:hypothetical protein
MHASPSRILHGLDDAESILHGFVTKQLEHVNAGICCGSVGISAPSDISTRHLRQEQPTGKTARQF